MRLELITLDGIKLDTKIYRATISTAEGEISVYPDHEPLVTIAKPGVISVLHKQTDTSEDLFAIGGGVVEVSPQRIRVLVDEADHSEEISEAEARAALERAIAMRDEAKDQIEIEKAHQLIDRHQVRLKVAELRRRKRH